MDTLRWSRYELGFNKEFLWEFLRISNIPTGFAHPNTVDSDCHVSINHGLEYHDSASFSPSMHCRIYINLEYYSLWEDLHHGSSVDQGGELLMIHCPKHNGSSCTLHLKKTSSRSSQHIWVFNWSPGLLGMYYEDLWSTVCSYTTNICFNWHTILSEIPRASMGSACGISSLAGVSFQSMRINTKRQGSKSYT